MKIRYLIEKSCEHGFFGKHITDHDPAGNTFCLTKPVVLLVDEGLEEHIAVALFRWRFGEDPTPDWQLDREHREVYHSQAQAVLMALIPADENR